MTATSIGIDLAWSARNQSGVAVITLEDEEITSIETCLLTSLDAIVERANASMNGPTTIAIDAPTVVPRDSGMRPCERELQRRFSIVGAAPYPANRIRLGQYNSGRPRGEELVDQLKSTLGALETGIPPNGHEGVYVMEVFPAPAMHILFGVVHRYKKKQNRSWLQCRAAMDDYCRDLNSLTIPRLRVPPHLITDQAVGKRFKALEDQVDALFCAYLAARAWLGGSLELVGNLTDGYIVLPARHGRPPFRSRSPTEQ